MAIRIEHQPAGGAVAAAAYATGRNRARQRRLEDFLEMWEKGRRRGNIYRNAMGGGAQRIGQQQQGEWEDPLASATSPEERVRIAAQRRANARALRLGQAVPYQEAEMQFRPAPTKEELEEQRWIRGIEHEQDIHERNRMESAEDLAERRTFDLKKSAFEDLQEQFETIGQGGADAWADPNRRKEYYRIKRNLEAGLKDQQGAKQLTPTEYYNKGVEEMAGFLEGHRPSHLVPFEKRPGYEHVTKDGRLIRKSPEGKDEDLGPAPWHMLTPEQQKAREADRRSRFGTDVRGREGQYRRDRYGEYFDPFPEQKAPPSAGEQYNEWASKVNKATKNYIAEKGLVDNDPAALAEARKFAMRLFPKPEEGGGARVMIGDDNRPIVPEEPVQEAGQRQPAMPGAMTRQPEPQELPKLLDVIPQAEPARGPEPTPAPVGTPLTEVKPEPVMPTGLPVAPPQNRAAAGLIEKGYEYVPLLNSKGQLSGKRGWRPPTPEQTVRLRGGGQVSGRVYREGDNYHILSDAGKVSLSADQVEGVESGQRVFSGPEASVTGPQPAERPLPEGMPAGAKWIDENTIQLPDGRKIRRGGM
jgi:hypothetical protein